MDNVIYPNLISVMYTDSIPLLAILFKILSPILPDTFQYFGLFAASCFILQGILSIQIIRKFNNNIWVCSIGSLFFLFAPIMLNRVYMHTALAAHFLILLAIYVWLNRSYFNTIFRKTAIWTLLMLLTVFIQIYFLPMICIILFFSLLHDIIEDRTVWKQSLIVLIVPVFTSLLSMLPLGAFHGTLDPTLGNAGLYNANLNTFVNPLNLSAFVKERPLAWMEQSDGVAYLGAGVLLSILPACYIFFTRKAKKYKRQEWLRQHIWLLPVTLCVICLLLISVSVHMTYNETLLWTIPYPRFIERVLAVFRCSGRYTWPIVYGIYILIIYLFTTSQHRKISCVILAILCIVQLVDLQPLLQIKAYTWRQEITYDNPMVSPVWSGLAQKYKHFVFMDIPDESRIWKWYETIHAVSEFALDHDMSVNLFHLARYDWASINETKNEYRQQLTSGTPPDDCIFLFDESLSASPITDSLHIYNIDGLTIGLAEQLVEIETIELSYKSDFNPLKDTALATPNHRIHHHEGDFYWIKPHTNLWLNLTDKEELTFQFPIAPELLASRTFSVTDISANGRSLGSIPLTHDQEYYEETFSLKDIQISETGITNIK